MWLIVLLSQAPTASSQGREGLSITEMSMIVGAVATPLLAGLGILWKELQTTKDEQKKNYGELKADHAQCEQNQNKLLVEVSTMKGRDSVVSDLKSMIIELLEKVDQSRGA